MGNMTEFFDDYTRKCNGALFALDYSALNKAYELISDYQQFPLFVFGNGGSAAIASHFCADYNKNIWQDTGMNNRAVSLVDNIPTVTAIANDSHYSYVFSQQIEMYKFDEGVVIAISSSGNSANIINGLAAAKKNKLHTIALVGFNGGSVLENRLADIILHVNCNNYGVVEDIHMMILHAITQKIRVEMSDLDASALKL